MMSLVSAFVAFLATSVSGISERSSTPELPGCGEVNLFFTGLPAYHPYVLELGLDPAMVDRTLRAEAAKVIAAGYNLRTSLAGPEVGLGPMRRDMARDGLAWHGTGIGFGARSSKKADVTLQFTDQIGVFREASEGPIMFNYNSTTFLWAVENYVPLAEGGCEGRPGRDLGYVEYCDVCNQTQTVRSQ